MRGNSGNDAHTMTKIRRGQRFWITRVLVASLGCFFGLALAEIYFRMTSRGVTVDRWAIPNPRYGFVHRPNFRQTVVRPWVETTYVWHVEINSLGFRGPEPDLSATQAVRILLLGDSFTFGYGVEYDQTFGAVLQRKLGDAGIQSIIFNAGVTGWGTAQQLLFASDHEERLNPDIVVLTFCENDPIEDEIFARGGAKGVLPSFPGKRWLRDHVHLYGVVYNAVSSFLYNRYVLQKMPVPSGNNTVPSPLNASPTVAPTSRFGGLEWYYRTMDLIRSFSSHWRKRRPDALLIVQNVEFWRNDFRDVMRVLETEGHIRFVDLRDDAGHLTPEQTKLPFDPHWNEDMHRISAERLAREILQWLATNKPAHVAP